LREERQIGRPRRLWEDIIKMDLWELGWGHGQGRSGSVYGHVVRSCECGNETSGSIKCGKFLDQLSISGRPLFHGVNHSSATIKSMVTKFYPFSSCR
jgi:hypothetical protein